MPAPTTKTEKIHLGLITQDPARNTAFKEALESAGGGYTHVAKNHFEMSQKLGMQKIHMLIYDCPAGETGAQAQALVQFFRSKREFQKIPICLISDAPDFEMKYLITDPRVRGFAGAAGAFLPIMTLLPFLHSDHDPEELQALSPAFIQDGFLNALKARIGNQTELTAADATDDDLHTSFLCQVNEEIRSHLGWIKFGARILQKETDGLTKIFAGMSPEMMEEVGQKILGQVVQEFLAQIRAELVNRGALFFPPIENLAAPDRKAVYANSKSSSRLFHSPEISVLLEVIRYF